MMTGMKGYEGVAVAAPVHLAYSRRSERSAAYFIGATLRALLEKSGVAKAELDGLLITSFTLAPDTVVSLTEHFALSANWLEQLPMGGASGPIAVKRAARAIQAGDAEIIACIAADSANDGSFAQLIENFSSSAAAAVYPYGAAGPNMVFAMITRHYMEQRGLRREDTGRLCIAQRQNALAAGLSLFTEPLTLDNYLNARPIAEPLHLYDCVMPVAGAEGFLVMTSARARSLRLPYAQILAAAERHNAFYTDPIPARSGWLEFADGLYEMAGLGPADMDFLQTYDDYPVIAMMQMEDLGFCRIGEIADFIRKTSLLWNGHEHDAGHELGRDVSYDQRLPHNTGGGQLSAGQAGAAGGFLGTVEALRQLLEPDLAHRVAGATRGLVSGYGMVDFDRCLSTSAVALSRPGES